MVGLADVVVRLFWCVWLMSFFVFLCILIIFETFLNYFQHIFKICLIYCLNFAKNDINQQWTNQPNKPCVYDMCVCVCVCVYVYVHRMVGLADVVVR